MRPATIKTCKVPNIFARFEPKLNFLDKFSHKFPIPNFTVHWDRRWYLWTDGHDDANKSSSWLCEQV